MYYLNGLLNEGMVQKSERQYQLTDKGRRAVSQLSLTTGSIRKQPQILVAVVAKNNRGEYLWSKWHRQPNTGLVSFPHGMMHYGESVANMAALELAEKAGLQAKLTYRGDVYVRGKSAQEFDRHMLVHIFEAADIQPGLTNKRRADASEPFWAALLEIPKADFLPGFYEIALLIDQRPAGHIFADIIVDVLA